MSCERLYLAVQPDKAADKEGRKAGARKRGREKKFPNGHARRRVVPAQKSTIFNSLVDCHSAFVLMSHHVPSGYVSVLCSKPLRKQILNPHLHRCYMAVVCF